MASKLMHQNQFSNVPLMSTLCGTVTLGAASIASQSFSGGTFTRDGVGSYTLTLAEVWPGGMQSMQMTVFYSSATFGVLAVMTDASATTKTITFKVLDAAGAAADLASGVKLCFCVVLKNSSVANG